MLGSRHHRPGRSALDGALNANTAKNKSLREITGDGKLSISQRLWYLVYNFGRGLTGQATRLPARYWHGSLAESNHDSPGRRYIDAFLNDRLRQLPFSRRLQVLDIGCGSGYVRSMLADLGFGGTYTGIDIVKDKNYDSESTTSFRSHLILKPIEQYAPTPTYELVLSNTALEHIDDDELAVKKASRSVAPNGYQIHIMPAFGGFFLYLWHGYRQYTPARVKKIFREHNQYQVYRLGGFFSFIMHFIVITVPELLLQRKLVVPRNYSWYPSLVKLTQRLDRRLPWPTLFYAVVIPPLKMKTEKQ